MDHWRGVRGLQIHEVEYESLIADTEQTSRRRVAFCGLEWDDACLAFHDARRVVRTASCWQVRQPIYAHSVGRWKRYAAHLGPFLERLNAP